MAADLHQTYLAMGLVLAIGVAINSVEWIRLSPHLRPGGLMARTGSRTAGWRAIAVACTRPPAFTVLLTLRLLLALVVILLITRGVLSPVALGFLFVVNLVVNHRLETRSGAAETLGLVILFACTAYANGTVSQSFATLGLWFVAAHTCIAYVTNGVAKAQSKQWRDGTFLLHLLSGSRFRQPRLGKFLGRHPSVAKSLCWSVVIGECIFPLALWVNDETRLAMLLLGVGFHLGIALLMGLNNFLWVFAATYPCFWYLGRA